MSDSDDFQKTRCKHSFHVHTNITTVLSKCYKTNKITSKNETNEEKKTNKQTNKIEDEKLQRNAVWNERANVCVKVELYVMVDVVVVVVVVVDFWQIEMNRWKWKEKEEADEIFF